MTMTKEFCCVKGLKKNFQAKSLKIYSHSDNNNGQITPCNRGWKGRLN